MLVEVLSRTDGHVTGVELIERCRELDPDTIPSTVYRTLDVLEELGVLSHSHGADGREEFHVLPATEHGHLYCRSCGGQWELDSDDRSVVAAVEAFDAGARVRGRRVAHRARRDVRRVSGGDGRCCLPEARNA